jgi:hypothetical protein
VTVHSGNRWLVAAEFRGLLIICAMTLLPGCGPHRPQRVSVSGQVLIDGKPLTCGTLMLVPEGARPSIGQIDKQGRFTLTCYEGTDGAVPGHHRIAVVCNEQLNPDAIRWLAPKKYADYRTSGLETQVDTSTDSLRIDLTWAGGSPFVENIHGGH